jgi:hypothetical protein
MVRARSALDRSREPAPYAGALAGLAVACGLSFRLDQYHSQADRSTEDTVAYLATDSRQPITQTQITVHAAVLSHRT